MREVQEAFGFRAVQTAREHLERLVEEGRLRKNPGRSRGYSLPESAFASFESFVSESSASGIADSRLPKTPRSGSSKARIRELKQLREQHVWIPMLGRVRAGEFQEAIENPEGYIPESYVPGMALGVGVFFALEVEGDSMIEAGILPGDQVIVRAQASAESGDIVVALVGDEATVKRFRRRRGRIELHPENSAYEPIIPEEVNRERGQVPRLLGKVIEVRRRYESR